MDKTKRLKVGVLFAVFTAIIAIVVQIIVSALLGTGFTADTLIAAAVSGACIFVVSFLTVLFVWPRIGFDPFDTSTHKST